LRILRHAQIDVTMDFYTEVSDEQAIQASGSSASSSTRRGCCTLLLYKIEKGQTRIGSGL
jgi:hypothetical protein